MSQRTIHILSDETDIVPSTGDPTLTLFGTPQLFAPPRPARLLSDDEILAATLIHELLSLTVVDD